MNVLKSIKGQLTEDERLREPVWQPTDELTEIGIDRLEEVAGAGDGTAVGVGHS